MLSGLDAFQAENVMENLRKLAQDGHTVICSIHQPRSSVYTKFDDIVLLAEGSIVYAGPARNEPLDYFSKFGFVAKPLYYLTMVSKVMLHFIRPAWYITVLLLSVKLYFIFDLTQHIKSKIFMASLEKVR